VKTEFRKGNVFACVESKISTEIGNFGVKDERIKVCAGFRI